MRRGMNFVCEFVLVALRVRVVLSAACTEQVENMQKDSLDVGSFVVSFLQFCLWWGFSSFCLWLLGAQLHEMRGCVRDIVDFLRCGGLVALHSCTQDCHR